MKFTFKLFHMALQTTTNSVAKSQKTAMKQVSQKIENLWDKGSEVVIKAKNINVHHGNNQSTFSTLNLQSDLLDGLQNMHIAQPTIIQMLGIPLVLQEKNVFCAAQTGSGKTLVYVTPIIQKLGNEVEAGYIGRLSRPRVLVLSPTRELSSQILRVFKHFSHYCRFRSIGVIGQNQKKWAKDYVKGLVDVVVGTPSTILKWNQKGLLSFSDVRYVVFDEADTLMDDNFRNTTSEFLKLLDCESNTENGTNIQFILTAATLPSKGVLGRYQEFIPDLQVCQSNLHKVLPHIKHSFMKTRQDQKSELLINKLTLFLSQSDKKCIIFCNTSKSCNWVSAKLDELKIDHTKLHGDMNPQIRLQSYKKFADGKTRLMVSTDIASRGLDSYDITLVVNFDCPFNATDYIHRSGRTGRAASCFSKNEEVLTFVTQNKEFLFAKKVQEAAKKNKCLEGIHSKKNSIIESMPN
ncbi:uncharacterized protein LOC100205532 isoform X3 [Hydra vulgaris]|uniref:RNA helicase n=1 Tax=Hydra vulgaris TaxID=6087 RepID=A0ABM4CHU4_HYDVU